MKTRLKNKRLAVPHRKIFAAVHPDWCLAASDNVAAVTAIPPLTENRKETNMQEMTNFTHPIELSNEELDLVAAGTGGNSGNNVGNNELIGFGDINVASGNQVQVGFLSWQSQNSHG